MHFIVLRTAGRVAAGVTMAGMAAAGVVLATPDVANAQALSAVCSDINAGGLDAPFVPGGNSTTLVVDDTGVAGEIAHIEWTNAASIEIKLNNAVVLNLTNSPSGSHDVTLTTGPSVGIIIEFDADPLAVSGSVDSSCSAGGATPPTTPTPGPASDAAAIVDGALSDQNASEPERTNGFFDLIEQSILGSWALERLNRELSELRSELDAEDDASVRDRIQERIDNLTVERDQFTSDLARARVTSVRQFAPIQQSPSTPSVTAISQYFDFGGDTVSGIFPLQSTVPGWTFNVAIEGAIIDRTFAALNRQTWVGSATLIGTHRLDPETVLGLGVKLGGAVSTTNNPVSTVNSTQIGADLAFGRLLSPDLFGGLYFGYELGAHQAMISGVGSNFLSHSFKVGGTLRGEMNYREFTLTPSASAVLQYRHRPSFTDAAAAFVPSSNTIDLDVTAGATISRDFDVPEKDPTLTPFLGANLLLDYTQTSPALVGPVIPGDPFKVQFLGGVRIRWDGGATASLQADVSRGANTTMFGLTGSFRVPIQ